MIQPIYTAITMLTLTLALALSPAQAVGPNVLFVGNSYTQFNNPEALDQSYAALVAEGMPAWEIESQRYARGGQTLAMHLEQATTDGTELNILLTGDGGTAWDFVVLQDQSQIPGFPATHGQFLDCLEAAPELAALVDAAGAETRLFMTWGRRDGDADNPDYYPDFLTMQTLLTNGYGVYADAIAEAGFPVEVVPVGMAFQAVYESHVAAGVDPVAGTLFTRLYSGDGSHPSPTGTYLSALMFYTAFTGQSPVGLSWAPGSVSAEDRDQLQLVVEQVMADAIEDDEEHEEEDTGSSEVSQDTSTGNGHEGLEEGEAEAEPEAATTDKKGCGCATGSRGGGIMALALLIAVCRREETPTTS